MNYLLSSGPRDLGKTSSVIKFHNYLLRQLSYTVYENKQYNSEVKRILINPNKTKKTLIWSETDQIGSINSLKDYLNAHIDVDTVIIASRDDGDSMRTHLWKTLNINKSGNYDFEIPLGRMKREHSRASAVN